jgi:hypothetical protein
MSKIPAREFLRDDNSARTTLDTILASPYTTLYEKPLRIMTINPNGEETVEVTRTTYKAINDTVSVDKITEICENIVMEKILGKEKSLMSQLLFSLGEQVIEVEKNLTSKIDTNIDIKVKNKHFDSLEKDITLKLENNLSERLRIMSTRITENLENDITEFEIKMNEQQHLSHNKLELYLHQRVEEEVNRQLSIIHGNIEKMIREDISKRLDKIHNNITKIIQEELNKRIGIQSEYENCQDGICLLPVQHHEDENINQTKKLENHKDQISLGTSISEDVASHGDITLLSSHEESYKYIDENLLPDGSDMIFDDTDETKEDRVTQDSKEEVIINELKEEVVTQETKEEVVTNELKEEVVTQDSKEVIINVSKEEDRVTQESKEVIINDSNEEVTQETKEEVVTNELKEEVIQETKEEVIINELKEEVIQETKEEVIINDSNEEITQETKEEVVTNDSNEEITQETKEEVVTNDSKEVVTNDSKEEVITNESKEEDRVTQETKEEVITNESNEEGVTDESNKDNGEIKEDGFTEEIKEDMNETNLKVIIAPESDQRSIENTNTQTDVDRKSKSVQNIPKLPLSHRKKKKIGGK